MRFTVLVSAIALAGLLSTGCGSNGSGDSGDNGPDSITSDIRASAAYTQKEVSETPGGERIIRTSLAVHFAPDATVDDLAALLRKYGATITTSVEGSNTVVVRIPDPGSIDALDAVVDSVRAEPRVAAVRRSVLPRPMLLPDSIDPANVAPIDHHLAVRAAPAWNARRAAFNFPSLSIIDYFGQGAPNTDYLNISMDAGDFGVCTGDCTHAGHGYRILGVISGMFDDSPGDAAGTVTGIYPGLVIGKAYDLTVLTPHDAEMRALQDAVSALSETAVIVNATGYDCHTAADKAAEDCTYPDNAELVGDLFAEDVRRLGAENRVLMVAPAGNVAPSAPGAIKASTSGTWASAALGPAAGGVFDSQPNLTNTLVVESSVPGADGEGRIVVDCLSADSFVGGHLSAPGDSLTVYEHASQSITSGSGTSLAAAQVAGLGLYLWAIEPSLTPQAIKQLLIETARPVPIGAADSRCSPSSSPAPSIDAYAALLALDLKDALDSIPLLSPVRSAILDVADDVGASDSGNRRFDERDIVALLDQFDQHDGAVDYGRGDLNGDGLTGGNDKSAFDLDMDRATSISTRRLFDLDVVFDEDDVGDLDVLCYYAYSPLYEGDLDARAALLHQRKCLNLVIETDMPASVEAGSQITVTVRVLNMNFLDSEGQPTGQPGVRLDLSQLLGVGIVDQSADVTDANGEVQVTLGIQQAATQVQLDITASSPEDAAVEFDSAPVQAQVTGGSNGGDAFAGEYSGTVRRWDMLDDPPSFVEQPAVIIVSAGGGGTHQLEIRHLHPSGSGQVVSTSLFDVVTQADGAFSGQSSNRIIAGQFSAEGGFTAQSNLDGDSTLPHDYAATRVP